MYVCAVSNVCNACYEPNVWMHVTYVMFGMCEMYVMYLIFVMNVM